VHARFDPALDASPVPVVSVAADGTIVRWNVACVHLLGVEASSALGRAFQAVLTFEPRDRSGRFPERQWAITSSRRVPVELTRWSAFAGEQTLVHHWMRDSSIRLAHEDERDQVVAVLRRQARSDALTGLANRFELEERLRAAVAGAGPHAAVVVVDLDGFKPINDTYGHAVGDEVLSAVAARLTACVRVEDTVARIGGDEFVVLARLGTDAAPAELTERIRQALAHPLTTSVGPLRVGASIGIAVSEHGQAAEELLRRADKAMYRIKLSRPPEGLRRRS
jgi:diguanylate cyclase (GGDEF)-like protein